MFSSVGSHTEQWEMDMAEYIMTSITCYEIRMIYLSQILKWMFPNALLFLFF
jgi:hypothetical protein